MATQLDVLTSDYHHAWHAGPCVQLITARGASITITESWRSNGQLKLWKRDSARFQLPIKYGLRECWYLTNDNAASFHRSDQCVPIVFHVASIKRAQDVLSTVRRAAYRVQGVPTPDQYLFALINASLLADAPILSV